MEQQWQLEELGQVCETFAGGTPSKSNPLFYGGDIPWITSSEVNQSYIKEPKQHISKVGLESSSAKWIPEGAILIAMYGATAGQVAELKVKATANQAVLAIIPRKADTKFVYYQLKQIKDKILFLAQGSGQPNLSKSLIDSMILRLPRMSHQRKIAHILSTCDRVIEKTEAAIAKYEALKQGLMQDLFTRGIDVETGRLRPSLEEAPELYEETDLGWLPKDWKVKILEELTTAVVDGTHFTPNYAESGIPFLRVTDIKNGNINIKKVKYISKEEHKELIKRCHPEKGDILYSKNGTVGVPKLIDWDWEFSIFVSLALIKVKSGTINNKYLTHLLSHEIILSQIKKRAKQGTVTNLHLEEIRAFQVPLPHESEQVKITQQIGKIITKISLEKKNLLLSRQLKAGLMQDLLTGRVEVPIEERANA